jgi:hypothetical protein
MRQMANLTIGLYSLVLRVQHTVAKESVTTYHLKERFDQTTGRKRWQFEELDIPMQPTGQLLVCVMVAKVEKPNRLGHLPSQVMLVPDCFKRYTSWLIRARL